MLCDLLQILNISLRSIGSKTKKLLDERGLDLLHELPVCDGVDDVPVEEDACYDGCETCECSELDCSMYPPEMRPEDACSGSHEEAEDHALDESEFVPFVPGVQPL